VNQVYTKCEKRRARRHCPGIGADICPQCCGEERENTIDCPLNCDFLRDARRHERPAELTEKDFPNLDIRLNDDFLEKHEREVLTMSLALKLVMEREKAVDSDAREALEAMVKTYRTLNSGLIYESRSQNPYAAAIQDELTQTIEKMRKAMAEEAGMETLRDADVLGTLVFLERLQIQHNNRRRRGRAFLDFLRTYFPEPKKVQA